MELLAPVLQPYAWGSHTALPALLEIDATGNPVAEAWWGAHPAHPSVLAETGQGLDAYIAQDPQHALGPEVAARFGALPFLLKILAIEAPLSLQVHPTPEQAQQGFAAEEAAGVALDARGRTFKDSSHKPEMVVPITPMRVLSGFRPLAETAADLRAIGGDQALLLAGLVEHGDGTYADYVRDVLTGPPVDDLLQVLASGALTSASARAAGDTLVFHPADRGALVALAMNAVELEPGQAAFTADGIMHSYQSGLGLEIMANSDNVIRGGLTPKHIDVDALLGMAVLTPSEPALPAPQPRPGTAAATFPVGAEEFVLDVVTDGQATIAAGPRIVLAYAGTATLEVDGATLELAQGQAAFVAYGDGELAVTARGNVAVASAP